MIPEALAGTDPEFVDNAGRFVTEVDTHSALDERARWLVRLAALIACQGRGLFPDLAAEALNRALTPVELKEVLYHAVPYLGLGKVYDFLTMANEVLGARGVMLPLPGQSTTTPETRFAQGWEAQARIVGADRLEAMHADADEETRHIQEWLTANCFGDHYTRSGLDLETRELLTFVLLVAHGGCDSQVRAHVAGNLRLGTPRAVLIDAISLLVPLIGYPRMLNALAAINEVAPAE